MRISSSVGPGGGGNRRRRAQPGFQSRALRAARAQAASANDAVLHPGRPPARRAARRRAPSGRRRRRPSRAPPACRSARAAGAARARARASRCARRARGAGSASTRSTTRSPARQSSRASCTLSSLTPTRSSFPGGRLRALEHEAAERVGRRAERGRGVRVQALERSGVRPAVEARGRARRRRRRAARPRRATRAARRCARLRGAGSRRSPGRRASSPSSSAMPPADSSSLTARTSTRQDSHSVVGNGAPASSYGRCAITLGPPWEQRAATPARARGGRPSWRSIASRSRRVADSTSGSVAAGRSTGADGEAVPVPPARPRPARSNRLHRARRLGATALLVLLVVLCVGPVRSYLHARERDAAAAHRGRAARSPEREAAGPISRARRRPPR